MNLYLFSIFLPKTNSHMKKQNWIELIGFLIILSIHIIHTHYLDILFKVFNDSQACNILKYFQTIEIPT